MGQREEIIHAHRELVLQLRHMEKQIEALLKADDPQWRKVEAERSQLRRGLEPLIERYWQIIPSKELSRCPYCRQVLSWHFDDVDLNGFWWMDRTQRFPLEKTCPHFCLLSGAVNLNHRKVEGGLFEALPGPDKPFVMPRILEMPSMKAVISEIKMHCGYTAYPIVYFSSEPLRGRSLTQSWARKEYYFALEDGRTGWDVTRESQDFNLKDWITSGKILVFREGRLSDLQNGDPLLHVQGHGRNQSILNHKLSYDSFAS